MLKSLKSSGTLNKHVRHKPKWYTTWEKKKNENLPFAIWMDIESIMLSEVSHKKTNTI